ncbi:MAG: TA system VapC family ribonuclease toxin [Rhizomicrobium sp.]
MILVDTNLLLYASIPSATEHARSREWLYEQLAGEHRIGLPWHSLLGFVRLASDRRVYATGPSVALAWQTVSAWLDVPKVWIPQPTDRHAEVLNALFNSAQVRSDMIMDTHLAALAIEHGLTLCSNDRDFARFPGLRWINPLEG